MERTVKVLFLALAFLTLSVAAWAADEELPSDLKVIEAATDSAAIAAAAPKLSKAQSLPDNGFFDPVRYTLGPDDVVQIDVLRHPEFSGVFPVNLEGKVQYKYVGDIEVTGMTKKGLEQKVKEIISGYVINPEVNVTIMEFKSKVIYVLGEVGRPGKYFMRSDSILVREALVQAGLPTLAAAMRRCRLITPNKSGKVKTKQVDVYSLLYGGDLKRDLEMRAGDVLYVPATVMAKIVRVINPVTAPIADLNSGQASATSLATR